MGQIDIDLKKKRHPHEFLRTIRTCTYSLLSFRLRVLNAIADYNLIVVVRIQKSDKDAYHDAARYLRL